MACSLLFPAIFEMITVIGPGSAPVTVDVADQVHRFGNVEGVLYPPSLLEDIIRSPAAFEALKKLKIVVFGGAPIEKSAGEILSKTINIMNFMGGTEVAFYPVLQVEPEDWNYFKFHPFFGHEMEPCGEGIYEQVIHQTTQSREASGLFQIYPELKVYRTKDLFLKHPTKEGLWSYHGRTDDLIILSHGQTLDPITMEAVIKRHPRVRSVIIAGDGRKHPLVLIEPTDDALSSKEERENLTDDIWPSIQEANKLSSDYVQLTRPLVIVAAPGKPFTRLGKGSVDRRNTVRDYEAEIAAAFDGLEPKTA